MAANHGAGFRGGDGIIKENKSPSGHHPPHPPPHQSCILYCRLVSVSQHEFDSVSAQPSVECGVGAGTEYDGVVAGIAAAFIPAHVYT